jgi:glycosidase
MSTWRRFPLLYEINTLAWLTELGDRAGEGLTLGDVPDGELDRIASLGFDGVWLMGVWQRSPAALALARRHLEGAGAPAGDIVASPYAILGFQVDAALGGDAALRALRARLRRRGVRLVLDFVPNHLARDHAWVSERPSLFVPGTAQDLARAPDDFFAAGGRVLAHGRDPYFPPWTDTVQLDHRRAETRALVAAALAEVAAMCDGVRCDMAMLVMRDVFTRTWGGAFDQPDAELWPDAIGAARARNPDFLTVAEAYWGLEASLVGQGFDFAYDKRLYDRLVAAEHRLVAEHLRQPAGAQAHLARFVENHDEPRAAVALGPARSRAAAVVALGAPGLRLLHDGQLEGRRLTVPVQLRRRPAEPPDRATAAFYRALLGALRDRAFHDGDWRLLDPRQAWTDNLSHVDLIAFTWRRADTLWLGVANLAVTPGQCYLPLPLPELGGRAWRLDDRLSDAGYLRDGDELLDRGLYLDLPGCGHHLFRVTAAG